MALKISRILHAGYVFECEETQIVFDPIFENPFSRNCYAFPDVQFDGDTITQLKFAAVFISHFHDDHCSFDSLNLLDRQTPIYVYCVYEELFSLIRELGFKSVHSLEINRSVKVGPLEVIPRRALDAEVDSIFQIKAKGLNVLNVVDSWINESTLDLLLQNGPWDLVLWPFQTMRELEVISPTRATPAPNELPAEWILQLKLLDPKFVVPSSCQFRMESWSWYNHTFFPITYSQFTRDIGSILPTARIIRMNPSVSFVLDNNSLEMSSPLSWVHPVGEQNVDYHYVPNLKPPTTAEIAKHFPPLYENQTRRVFDYCNAELLEKYQSMETPEELYFSKPRLWQLSVYEHTGSVTQFLYRIYNTTIEIVEKSEAPLAWTTEVPIAKLYAALELGESLTSMYMRVNDCVFTPEIEKQLASVEIVEDPLIRCLFNGVFGAYQRAQLKRLKMKATISSP